MDHCDALQRLADRLSSLIRVAGCMDEWFEELLVLPGVKAPWAKDTYTFINYASFHSTPC